MTPPRRAPYRLGTRASGLARAQSRMVRDRLQGLHPEAAFTEVLVTTDGDRDATTPLPNLGGEGVFTSALERALRANEIDFAVHSLKDMPVAQTAGLTLAAIGTREDARDALVARNEWTLETLPRGARVGTCSVRRSAQLRAIRPDLTMLPLRGNVDTRVRQVEEGAFDAIVLAAAGLHRLGLHSVITEYLSLEQMLPAPGQGALAVQCRSDDGETSTLVTPLDDAPVRAATVAERALLEGLGGGCSAPIAAFANVEHGRLSLRAVVASPDGRVMVRVHDESATHDARQLGLALAARAREQGATALLS